MSASCVLDVFISQMTLDMLQLLIHEIAVFRRLERDKQLMDKIKQHTQRVQERKNKPKGNPQEQMEAAKRDLELVRICSAVTNHY